MKKFIALVICVVLLCSFSVPAFAEEASPTETFTHWAISNGNKSPVSTKPLYNVRKIVTSREFPIEESFGEIVSIDSDPQGNLCVLNKSGKIFVLDKDYNFVRYYDITDEEGNKIKLSSAKGIYTPAENEIYISDTENNRILYCVDSIVSKEIMLPDSPLIPNDFVFKPTSVVRDKDGYLYVISEGSYYGAIIYSPSGEFSGFFGANTVKSSVLTALGNLWDRLTMNDIKRAKVVKALPYQFSGICLDDKGFVYTCTGMNADDSVGQIRMLSPGGDGILNGAESFNFGESDVVNHYDKTLKQNFTSIEVDEKGYIYALDNTYGLIYIYDTKSNMIGAFGGGMGQGNKAGTFASACALTMNGNDIIIADSARSSLTVFSRTKYGQLLLDAQQLTLESDYAAAEPLWKEVLKNDPVCRLAQKGLAYYSYQQGDYSAVMDYAKQCEDASLYSKAKSEVQNNFVNQNFLWIFALAIVTLAGLSFLIIISIKKQVVIVRNEKLRILFSGMIHPFQSFGEIKYKAKGSLAIAAALSVLFYLTSAAVSCWSDFRYSSYNSETYNTLFQMLQTLGLVVIWSIANWGISTLRDGKGRLKEVFIVSAYSTLPIILYNVISIPITYLVADSNSTLLSGLHTIALIFCGIMLTVGLMIIHDYNFPKFLITALVTVLFILLIIFVVFMVGMLLSQFISFFFEAIGELSRRV